jgi:hypothetical protein
VIKSILFLSKVNNDKNQIPYDNSSMEVIEDKDSDVFLKIGSPIMPQVNSK